MNGSVGVTAAATWLVVTLLVAACSGSPASPSTTPAPPVTAVSTPTESPTPPPKVIACPGSARATLVGLDHGARVTLDSQVRSGLSTCTYRALGTGTPACRQITLMINTAAQAFVDFNRQVTEQAQNSSIPGRKGLAPREITAPRLGLEVDWVPARRMLDTGSPGRWVTIVLSCRPGATGLLPAALALARAAA